MNSYCLLRASTAVAIHLNNQMKKIILMAPYSVPFSEVQTVARLFPTIHDHCRRVSLPVLLMSFASCLLTSVGCSLSQVWFQNLIFLFIFSHFSPYLRSKLINICFFAILSSFFGWFFPLFLFFSFKLITQRILLVKPKNQDKRFHPTIQLTMGEKSVHPTWASQVTVWPQTRSARPMDSPPWAHQKSNLSNLERKWEKKKSFIAKDNFDPLSPNFFFWLLLSSRCSYPVTINFNFFVFCLYPNSDLNK